MIWAEWPLDGSIAEIDRAKGEDLASDDTKRACLEVLAFGGHSDDDEPEIGYWTIRTAFTRAPIELVIKQVASRLAVVLSDLPAGNVDPDSASCMASGGL